MSNEVLPGGGAEKAMARPSVLSLAIKEKAALDNIERVYSRLEDRLHAPPTVLFGMAWLGGLDALALPGMGRHGGALRA